MLSCMTMANCVHASGDLLRHSARWLQDHGFDVGEPALPLAIGHGFSVAELRSVDLTAAPPRSALDFEALAQAIERSESIKVICLGPQCAVSDAALHRLSRAVGFGRGSLEEVIFGEDCGGNGSKLGGARSGGRGRSGPDGVREHNPCNNSRAYARLEALLARNAMRTCIQASLRRVGG